LGFYKITLNTRVGAPRACIYNSGCNFRCIGCAYKLYPEASPTGRGEMSCSEIIASLQTLRPRRVNFIGGEPTTNPSLEAVAAYAREDLGATTKLGHSNGSRPVPPSIDEALISIKCIDEDLHIRYTGVSNESVLNNFIEAHGRGVRLEASTVLIPGMIGAGEVGRVARFIAGIDEGIPLHITGYMPVPGAPWRAPTRGEIREAVALARRHLRHISCRSLSPTEFSRMKLSDPAFMSMGVA